MNWSQKRRNSSGIISDVHGATQSGGNANQFPLDGSMNAEADNPDLPPLDGILRLSAEILVELKARVTRPQRAGKKNAPPVTNVPRRKSAADQAATTSRVPTSETARKLFLLGGTVSRGAAEDLLGVELVRTLVEAGLLETAAADVRCLFRFAIFSDLLILEESAAGLDRGHATGASKKAREAFRGLLSSEVRFANSLNLLAGTGAIALWSAGISDRVLAVANGDRSLMFCKINAMLNGVQNIEFHDDVSGSKHIRDKYDLITIDETESVRGRGPHEPASGGDGVDADKHFKQLTKCLRPSGRAIITFESYGEFARRGYGVFRDAENFKTILFLQQAPTDAAAKYEIPASHPSGQSSHVPNENETAKGDQVPHEEWPLREDWVPSEKLAATLVVEASAPDEGWHGVVPLTGGPWEGLSPMLIDTLFL
jgi:hypothetical protein